VTVALRPAGEPDVDAIMAIERASFPTDAWSEAAMRSTLVDADSVAELAEAEARVVGYAALLAPIGAPDAEVLTIAVDERHRGVGVGRALLTHLLDAAARRGARRVFLEVRADNPVAQALYASEGFEPVGRRPRYYQPDDVDAIVMRLELRRRRSAA
jgi:ribosomal-protein-alanine N-acetyltransferase